jgi:4-hydroxybenzoate polyprenyltransferase
MAWWLPGDIKEGLKWIVANQFIIAVSAVCLTLETFLLVGWPLKPEAVTGFVFCSSLAIYNLAFLGKKPFEWTTTDNKKRVFLLFGVASACSMAFIFYLSYTTVVLAAITALGGLLYLYKLPWLGKGFQLRDIPLAKNILLALIWSMVTVLIPLSAHTGLHNLPSETPLIFFRRFFFIVAIAIPYDIRDYTIDTRNRLHTLPVSIGINKTKVIAMSSLLVFALLIIFDPFHPQAIVYSFRTSLALFLSAIFTGVIILMSTAERKKIYFSLLLDGSMILQFLLLLVCMKAGNI